jgi:hypothetical protein
MRRAELRQALGQPAVVESPATADLYDDPAEPTPPPPPPPAAPVKKKK